MRIIKLILSLILVFCLSWLLLIFAGGSVVKGVVKLYFGDQLILHDVEVSPTLDIFIKRTELNLDTKTGGKNSGFSRAVSLDWSILAQRPFIKVLIGPTNIDGIGRFQKAEAIFTRDVIFGDAEQDFSLGLFNVGLNNYAVVEKINAEGELSSDLSILKNVDFELLNLNSNYRFDIHLEDVSGHFDRLNLWKPVHKQNNIAEFSVQKLMGQDDRISLTQMDVTLKNSQGKVEVYSETKGVVDKLNKSSVNKIIYLGNFDLGSGNFVDPSELFISGMNIPQINLEIDDFKGFLNANSEPFSLNGGGKIANWQLMNEGQFLGRLEDGHFKINLALARFGSGFKIGGDLTLDTEAEPSVILTVTADTNIKGDLNKLACIDSVCSPENLRLAYSLSASGHFLRGSSVCPVAYCSGPLARHAFVTDNTSKFFQNLGQARILNPIVLATIYSQFLSGRSVGSGHEIEF